MPVSLPRATKTTQRTEQPTGPVARREPRFLSWPAIFKVTVGLCVAFFLALYATAISEKGDFRTAAIVAGAALAIAVYIAIRLVPFLARQVARGRLKLRIEYEVTREGVAYLLVIVVIAVAALNTGNNLLFLILAIMLAAIVGSGVLSRLVLSGIDLEMTLPPHIFAGQPVTCPLKLHNHKRHLPSYSLTVSPAGRASTSWWRKSRTAEPRDRQILATPVYIPYLPKASVVEQDVELRFPHRGRFTQEGFVLSSKFPFGFIRKKRSIETREELLVLPAISPIGQFRSMLATLGGGVPSLSRDSRGDDLYGLRDYRPSDSARTVDWKATARARRLKVREFSREDDQCVRLILDNRLTDLSASTLERFERAIKMCASLAWYYASEDAHLGFATCGFDLAVGRGEDLVYSVLEALANLEPKPWNATFALPPGPHGSVWNIVLSSRPESLVSAEYSSHLTLIRFEEI